jgi:hypothetical protein
MAACGACGAPCRKAQLAVVLPEGKRRRVCRRCAAEGLLTVATRVAPVMRQESLFTADPLDDVARTVAAWLRLEGSDPSSANEANELFIVGRKAAYESVLQLIKRTKETGT